MAVVAFGLMLNDACFLYFSSHPWLLMRSKMYVLLVGPVLDGLLGGLSTVTATIHAYVSDVTPPGSRATVFSQVGGSLMLGLLFGPATSSAVVYLSDNM
jgi:MFS family permease